ncbi:MAG: knotted carbamoyltransferase YgeW [Verrucomicrobia bacterium]|nr:knotted carbamoyltransferase YgeW [Verrucomicrobiota bacterium]
MTPHRLAERAEALAELRPALHDKDFLLSYEQPDDAIAFVNRAAGWLHDAARAGLSLRMFDGGVGISIFRDKSTRTRYAYRAACSMLGLQTEEIDESTSQIAHGETVRETAAMLGFCTEVVGIRDDMFLDEGHKYMTEVAASLEESAHKGALLGRPAVVNLQCDIDHPTQALADLCHLEQVFGGLPALRGKKLVMSWASSPSYGKPLSVPQGIVSLLTRFGMDVVLAHPEGYELLDAPLAAAERFAKESGGSFTRTTSMREAFAGADVVYPKSWAPAWVMRERTKLLRGRETAKLAALEADALAQNARHQDWECTEDMMSLTRDGKALYMHCLPADVSSVSCERGEVAASVFERARLDTYREASHKPFVIAAMILATRFADPAAELLRLARRARRRRGA